MALKALVVKAKRTLAKVLRPMMLPWLQALFDPEYVVRAAAKSAFTTALPPNKIADSFMYCREEILSGAEENIRHTVQTLCDPKLYTKEEADEMYDRTVSSTLLALAYVLESISPEQASDYFRGHEGLWGLPSFWKFSAHSSVLIRSAFYTIIRACCITVPRYLHHDTSPEESKLKIATSAVLGAFGDKDCSTHQQLWECVLVFLKVFPQSWTLVNLPKAILPRLWSFVRHAAYGSVEISHPCFVTFMELYVQAGGDYDMHTPMLENLWASLGVSGPRDPKHKELILDSLFECFKHGLVHFTRKDRVEDAKQLLKANLALAVRSIFGSEESCLPRAIMTIKVVKLLENLVQTRSLVILQEEIRTFVLELVLECASLRAPQADQVSHVTHFICNFSRDSESSTLFLSIAARLCLDAMSICEAVEHTEKLVSLKLLAEAVSWWGPQLFEVESLDSQDKSLHRYTPVSFCTDALFPILSSTLDAQRASDVIEGDALEVLTAAMIIAVNILREKERRATVWPQLLECVAGGLDAGLDPGSVQCRSLQALAVLLETVSRGSLMDGPWHCAKLDAIVLRCFDALCFREAGSSAPGILESARLTSVALHALSGPLRFSIGTEAEVALLSDTALTQLSESLVEFLHACAQRRQANLRGAALAVNEGAGPAALDMSERLISGLAGLCEGEGGEGGIPQRLRDLVGAVFALLGHSDGAAKAVSYQRTAAEGSRLRSRLGCRASDVWDACGRKTQVCAAWCGRAVSKNCIAGLEMLYSLGLHIRGVA